MCGAPFWGVAGAAACAYFAYLSYSHLREGDVGWSHDWWSLLTYGVWIALILAMISETRCWRERTFFVLVLLNLTLGFVFSIWTGETATTLRTMREISIAIWALAALASIRTITTPSTPMSKLPEEGTSAPSAQ